MTAQGWHALAAEQVSKELDTGAHGLSESEAAKRLAVHGHNRLPPSRRRGPFMRFLLQFHNALIYVLLGAAVLTAVLTHWVDTGVILGVVVINAIIGFVQEGKAERALEAIRSMLSPHAAVLRDGRRRDIAAADLVPGDVVLVAPGDRIPADLRLLAVKSLRIEEAALTGESQPVEKSLEPVAPQSVLAERFCMAYFGTLVTYGQGQGVVVATGAKTEIGRISALIEQVEQVTTPLLRKMEQFGRWLTLAILGFSAATFAFGVTLRNYSATEMFLAVVGLAVAAVPEGLPAIMTITLAIGVQRMARRNAIIRRLPAVETLGSVTVICSDKTGTLTRNEMTVQSVVTGEREYEVSGAGYTPEGGFSCDGSAVLAEIDADLAEVARAALLCNDATLRERKGAWHMEGDPTEGALLTLAFKAGFNAEFEPRSLPRIDVIPFESEHRFMATLHHDHAGHAFAYLKGAPERVLDMCHREHRGGTDHPLDIRRWHRQVEQLAAQGKRVLAFAFLAFEDGRRELRFDDVEQGLTLIGLVGIIDPPREEAIRAVGECRAAGIRVKMITGDHVITACAIGAQLGIGDGATALAGSELERMDDDRLKDAAARIDVFARASPEHKLRLVRALQANNEVVAMTGDGVNDAPALKRADVGVAMGLNGTEAAKEAAEMVLADDNFASIVHAVEEGRTIYDNLKKAILFIFPTNGGEAGVIVLAILLGVALPITAVQILWVNMVTAVTLSLAIAFEPPEAGVMRRPPRPPSEPLLSKFLVWRIVLISMLLVTACFGLFEWELAGGASLDAARTVAVNMLVAGEIFYVFNSRHVYASALSLEGITGNRSILIAVSILLVLQAVFTYAPFAQHLFGTAAIDAASWLRIIFCAAMVFLAVEGEKWLLRRRLGYA